MNTPVKKMHMTSRSTDAMRVDLDIRDLNMIIDEPAEIGGSNSGPSPIETAVAALTGCTSIIIRMMAKMKGIKIENLNVDAETDFDMRGVLFREEIDVPFQKITLHIQITGHSGQDELEELKQGLRAYCPLYKLFTQAGTKIVENWELIASSAS